MRYLHQHPDWPNFRYDAYRVAERSSPVLAKRELLLEQLGRLSPEACETICIEATAREISESCAIEGVVLHPGDLRVALARRLHPAGVEYPADRAAESHAGLMLDCMQNFAPMDRERLCGWQAALFPCRKSGVNPLRVGDYRKAEDGEMQIISGPIGHQTVHYVAPDAELLESEMESFFGWLNSNNIVNPIIKSAIAHFWFVSIHPFMDGNGRTARALAAHVLAKSEKLPIQCYSVSAEINARLGEYYDILDATQKGDMDITKWLLWTADVMEKAVEKAILSVGKTLRELGDLDHVQKENFSKRQRRILSRLHNGVGGHLTEEKYAKICKCTADVAALELQQLVASGLLQVRAGIDRDARSVYSLPTAELENIASPAGHAPMPA